MNKLTHWINNLIRHPFVVDTSVLGVGTFFNTGLGAIFSIILARLLGPEQFGLYALVFSLAGLIGIFLDVGAGYGTLTLFAEAYAKKDKEEIQNILSYFLKISFIIIFSTGLIGFIIAPSLSAFLYNNAHIGQYLRFVLVAGFLGFSFSLTSIALQVIRKIKKLTILESANKILFVVIPTALLFAGYGLIGVFAGQLASVLLMGIVSLVIYVHLAKKDPLLPSFLEIVNNLKQVSIKKYFNFGFLIAVDKNFAELYKILPITFLGMFATTSAVAYFKLALSYITLPLLLLKPVSRLLMVQLPKSKVSGLANLEKIFWKVSLYSGFLTIGILIPVLILTPFLIIIFYGQDYSPAVKIAYPLALYTIMAGFAVGIGSILRTLNKVEIGIKVNFFVILLSAPIVFYSIKYYVVSGTIFAVIALEFIPLVIVFYLLHRYFRTEK